MTSLTCVFALERVTGIEPSLSAREVCVAGHPPPDWLTCGSADTLPVRDRGCLLRLLSSGTQRARDLQIRRSGRIVHRCLRGGPIFQICRRVPVVGWRLGSSAGYSPGCVPTLRIMSVHVLAGPPTAGASAVVHDGWHLGALVLVTTQEPPRMHGPICLPRYVASFSTQPTKAHSPENKIANATTVTRTFRPGTGLPLTRRASETVMIALVITEERMNQPTEPRSPR
jgi:hypothetical protein